MDAKDALDYLLSLWTLDCNLAVLLALVLNNDIEILRVLHNPCDILVNVRCIDDKEEALSTHSVYKQVIDNATCRVTHHAIEYLAVGSTRNVIGKDIVHELLALGAGNEHLSHVRYIEYAARLTHCIVLIDDVGVLYWHVKATERAYESTECHMLVIKTGSLVFHKSVS